MRWENTVPRDKGENKRRKHERARILGLLRNALSKAGAGREKDRVGEVAEDDESKDDHKVLQWQRETVNRLMMKRNEIDDDKKVDTYTNKNASHDAQQIEQKGACLPVR